MNYALALTGPTASGKTALSLLIAERYGCEIISCDSMQIYRDMNIGTAKATPEEQRACPHHLIDFLSPSENYSAENYREDALSAMDDIRTRGRLPLFVGGTGLYIDTLMRGVLESPPSCDELKDRLMSSLKTEEDKTALWERLYSIDPESAEKIHKNNVRRVARAVEIYELTGKTKTYFDEQSRKSAGDISLEVITLDFHNRENLYDRVNLRVDRMMEEGLTDEVKSLYERGLLSPGNTASQAIGYKELVAYIEDKCSLDEAVELIKLSSRRYAKRQLTWFRHIETAHRIYVDREDGEMKEIGEIADEIFELIGSMPGLGV